jgi:hypothetical protein
MMASGSGWAGWVALLVGLSALACEQPPQDAGEPPAHPGAVVLARVGDEAVTVDDLGWVPARVKPANRLEMLVTRKLAAHEARRRGLAEDPSVRAKLAQYRYSALTWEENLLRNALFNSIRLEMKFSEEELRAHFAKTEQRYVEPQWKLMGRNFPSEAEARAASEALGATGRLDPATSEKFGPVPAEGLPVELAPLLPLFKQPGDRQIVNRGSTWTLFELDVYRPAEPLPFESVRGRVEQDLAAVRAETVLAAELEKLRAEQVVIDQAALASYEKDKSEVTAAAQAHRAATLQGKEAAPPEATP